jgi:peptidoglycan/LPS O-acetylase OafA/YrhL
MSDEKLPAPTQAQIDKLMEVIERVERRRKIMLAGYLIALVLLVGGQVIALYVFSQARPGTFIGWIFFVPFLAVGLTLWLFGWLSRSKKPTR